MPGKAGSLIIDGFCHQTRFLADRNIFHHHSSCWGSSTKYVDKNLLIFHHFLSFNIEGQYIDLETKLSSCNFSQKWSNDFFSIYETLTSKFKFQVFSDCQVGKTNSFVCFMGEVTARQFCFEIYWPLILNFPAILLKHPTWGKQICTMNILYNCSNKDSSSQDLYIMTLTESSEGKMMSRQCVHCIVVAHSDAVSATKWQYVALWKLHRADG